MTPQTVTLQASLFMGFSKQEYWSGLPFPSPGDLPDLGIKLMFLVSPALAGRYFTTEPLENPSHKTEQEPEICNRREIFS